MKRSRKVCLKDKKVKQTGYMETVAYLGPEATFSHQAAMHLYGGAVSFYGAETIEEVFNLVKNSVCGHGVVPVENSYEGSINITLDLLHKYDIVISGESFMRIRHHLLSMAKSHEDIRRIYSHTMPIAQCRSWLRDHMPGISLMEVASTSLAAKMAAASPGSAAIGSRFTGETYGLNILKENIEDDSDNVTRFLVIGKNRAESTGKDKTSLIFSLLHEPGTLYRCLAVLAERNVNITRIESRPMRMRNWEYIFFMDIEGHEEEPDIEKALIEMERHCVFMKRLGSYPEGGEPWE